MSAGTRKKIKKILAMIPPIKKGMVGMKMRMLKKYSLSEHTISQGEESSDNRIAIVRDCEKKWPKHVAELNGMIDEYFAKIPNLLSGRDVDMLRTDVLFNALAYGFTADEYFSFHLEGKTQAEKREYISDLDRYILVYQLNDFVDLDIFRDKFSVYKRLKPYYKREAICIETESDYSRFKAFIEKHPVFVRKTIGKSRGKGVSLIDCATAGMSEAELFSSLISMGKQMLEERIIQTPEMSAVNPSSINTVRCPTLRTKRGVELAPCRFRVGQGGSFVDNSGSGGISVSVDRDTGILETNGWDEYGKEYVSHPESGVAFLGHQLPDWDLLVRTVKEMANEVPGMGYISWDMAHTANGWVIVEANGQGQFIGAQMDLQRGIKKEILEQLDGMLSPKFIF